MPLQWQTVDVPFIQGIDSKSNDYGNGSQLADLVNGVFTETGVIKRRNGYVQLGANLTTGNALGVLGSELLAQDGVTLKSYSPGNNSWASKGLVRSVPVRSGTIAQAQTALTMGDCASGGGYTVFAWLDAAGTLHMRVDEEATGATVVPDAPLAPGAVIKRVQCIAQGGFIYVLFSDSTGRLYWKQLTTSTLTWGGLVTVNTFLGSAGAFRVAAVSTGNLVVLYIDGSGIVQQFLYNSAATSQGGGAISGVVAANPNAALAVAQCGTFIFSAWVESVSGDFKFLVSSAAAVIQSGPTTVAAGLASSAVSASFAYYSTGLNVSVRLVFTVAVNYGNQPTDTKNASVKHQFVVSDGTLSGSTSVLYNGVMLASDLFLQDSDQHFWIRYYSPVASTVSNSNAKIVAANSVYLLVNASKNILARALQGAAALSLDGARLASVASGSSGKYVTALPVASSADTKSLTSTTVPPPVAIGYVRTDFTAERMRSLQVGQELLISGGAPTVYDGTAPVEAGFAIFPEIISVTAKPDFITSPATWAASTTYGAGQIVQPVTPNGYWYSANAAGTSGGTQPTWPTGAGSTVVDGGVTWTRSPVGLSAPSAALNTAYALGARVQPATPNGYEYQCTKAGTSAGTAPTWPTPVGATVTDGGVTWLCASTISPGVAAPLTTSSLAVVRGTLFTPSQPNGYYYAASSSATLTAEPIYPMTVGASVATTVSGGSVTIYCVGQQGAMAWSTVGTSSWGYSAVYEWIDSKGLLHQSYQSPTQTGTIGYGSNNAWSVVVAPLRVTRKSNVRVALYRTARDGTLLQKVASVTNDPTVQTQTIVDGASDLAQSAGQALYTSIGEIPNEPPPAFTSAAVRGQRLYYGGGEDPYTLGMSKTFAPGYAVGFSSLLAKSLDPSGGPFGAVATMDGYTIIFQSSRISVLAGDGPDNTGAGSYWNDPQPLASDVGCSNPDSVVLTPLGLMFQSSKGIYLLSRDLQTQYIGSPVEAYNGQTVTAARVVPGTTQVRFHCSTGRTLVYDYFVRQWSTFVGVSGADAAVWNGAFVYLGQVGQVMKESGYVDYNGTTPAITITTVPIKFDGVDGYVRCRGFEIALLEDPGVPTYSIQVSVESNSSLNAYGTFGRQSSNPLPARQWVYLRAADAKTSMVRVQLQEMTPPAGVVGIKFVGLRFEVGVKGGARQVPSTIKLG